MKGAPQKNLVRSMALQYLMRVKPSMNMHSQKTSLPPLNVVTRITDSNNEVSVIDKHTFHVGDDLYEEDLPKPHIQYTSHQLKHLQIKDQ